MPFAQSISAMMLLVLAAPISAAPPPPPPPGAIERADDLAHPPALLQMPAYLDLFEPSVRIFVNAKLVATSRGQWSDYLRSRDGQRITVLKMSYGNPIILVESVSTLPTEARPGIVYDRCFWARVEAFHSAGGKIDEVQITQSESQSPWGGPERPE